MYRYISYLYCLTELQTMHFHTYVNSPETMKFTWLVCRYVLYMLSFWWCDVSKSLFCSKHNVATTHDEFLQVK
jgi:hypothetical protein